MKDAIKIVDAPEPCLRCDGKDWIKVAEADDNFMRKCSHTFEKITAEKIRVTVLETWGDPSARIMEIRASLEKIIADNRLDQIGQACCVLE